LKGSPAEARRYALKLIHYRFRSENEMMQRLKRKGFDNNLIHSTMKYLKNVGLIRDETLASELLKTTIENKHLGRRGIALFLSHRGIKQDTITKTLSGVSEDIEKDTALRLVEKKLKTLKQHPEHVIKRRLWGMLQRRGFSTYIINFVMKSIEGKES
jgi:regulatory protein